MAIDYHLIIELAREYYGIRATPERASEIAAEVNALNDSVRAAAKGYPSTAGPTSS